MMELNAHHASSQALPSLEVALGRMSSAAAAFNSIHSLPSFAGPHHHPHSASSLASNLDRNTTKQDSVLAGGLGGNPSADLLNHLQVQISNNARNTDVIASRSPDSLPSSPLDESPGRHHHQTTTPLTSPTTSKEPRTLFNSHGLNHPGLPGLATSSSVNQEALDFASVGLAANLGGAGVGTGMVGLGGGMPASHSGVSSAGGGGLNPALFSAAVSGSAAMGSPMAALAAQQGLGLGGPDMGMTSQQVNPYNVWPGNVSGSTSAIARAISLTQQQQRRPRSEKKPIPEELKDIKYFERRKRNNVAAKKSRDARKAREDEIAIRASFLEKENAVLRAQVATLREEANSLRQLLLQKRSRP